MIEKRKVGKIQEDKIGLCGPMSEDICLQTCLLLHHLHWSHWHSKRPHWKLLMWYFILSGTNITKSEKFPWGEKIWTDIENQDLTEEKGGWGRKGTFPSEQIICKGMEAKENNVCLEKGK